MSLSDISLLLLALPSTFIEPINIDTDSQYNAGPSEPSSHNATSISTQQPLNAIVLPAGYTYANAGKHRRTSWIWQHGLDVVRQSDGKPYWLCKLCK